MRGGACLPAAIVLEFRAVDFHPWICAPWIPAVLVALVLLFYIIAIVRLSGS